MALGHIFELLTQCSRDTILIARCGKIRDGFASPSRKSAPRSNIQKIENASSVSIDRETFFPFIGFKFAMEYAIIGAVVLIAISVATYYILRFMKGKIELHLTNSSAASGEPIKGSVSVVAKKELQGRLTVSLVCIEESRQQKRSYGDDDDDDTKYETTQDEIFRKQQVLEDMETFSPTNSQEYQFNILAPTASESGQRGSSEHGGGGMIGTLLNMAASASDSHSDYLWHVEARLDVKGIDLFAKQEVNVRVTR